MPPAQQGFLADNPPVLDPHLGLIEQLELLPGQRPAQIAGDHVTAANHGIEAFIKEADRFQRVLQRALQCLARTAQQIIGGFGIRRIEGDANAWLHRYHLGSHDHRSGKGLGIAPDPQSRIFGFHKPANGDKLGTTNASDRPFGRLCRQQPRANRLDNRIGNFLAVSLDDIVEMGKLQGCQHEGGIRPGRLQQRRQVQVKTIAIGKAGQAVHHQQRLNMRLSLVPRALVNQRCEAACGKDQQGEHRAGRPQRLGSAQGHLRPARP